MKPVKYEQCPWCKGIYPEKAFNIRQLKTIHTELLCLFCEWKRNQGKKIDE
jgi:hypothetical protein